MRRRHLQNTSLFRFHHIKSNMAALCRATGWYKRQHLSEETPAKPFLVCVRLRQTVTCHLLDDDNAVNKAYESRVLKGESSSDESDEEKHENI
ncbi:hypothetical protein TNCV_2362901 [Trichonephila clavipes]|nr:hypothetical protein TNCV_2362901 [Trichonephila clavipes]